MVTYSLWNKWNIGILYSWDTNVYVYMYTHRSQIDTHTHTHRSQEHIVEKKGKLKRSVQDGASDFYFKKTNTTFCLWNIYLREATHQVHSHDRLWERGGNSTRRGQWAIHLLPVTFHFSYLKREGVPSSWPESKPALGQPLLVTSLRGTLVERPLLGAAGIQVVYSLDSAGNLLILAVIKDFVIVHLKPQSML